MKKEKLKKQPPGKTQHKPNSRQKELPKKNSFPGFIALAIIILLGIIIYSNSFNCSFHLDDRTSIVDNAAIRNMYDVKALWNYSQTRFITYYTFALNYHFDKFNMWGYHLFNLIIHLINACLVYWLTLLIFSSPALKGYSISKNKQVIALLTALLFVSHPLATQSVTYIVQRMASMVAMFYFLSLALYMKARLMEKSNATKYLLFAGSFLSALSALLCKENAFTLPFAIVLFELFFLQTKKVSINFKDYRVVLLIAALTGFIVIVLLRFSSGIFKPLTPTVNNDFRTITSQNYLLTQFSVILKYIQLLFLPLNQNLDYDYPISNSFFEPATMLSFLSLLALLILAIFLYNKNRIISFGIFWFFLTLSIESSIIPIADLIFEHRTYLPSYGFFLILISVINLLLWNKYKYIAISVFVIIIGSNSFLTYQRNKIWKDEHTLWNDVTSKSPNKARAYFTRGIIFNGEKNYKQALDDYNKTIELSPNYADAYYDRGILLENEKEFDKANKDYTKAIELYPGYTEAYINRGNLYRKEARYNEALNDYRKAIELNPDLSKAYYNRGILLMIEKKFKEATDEFTKVIELKTDVVIEAYYNRGMAKYFAGNKDDSCMDLKEAAKSGYQPAADFSKQFCH